MLEVLLVLLAAGWAITGFWSVNRIRGLREANDFLSEAQSEAAYRAIEAERARGVAETESQYMKITLANLIQRPAVAVLTEENIQQLGAILQSFLKPERMN